jgi:hypothetical protein
MEDAMLISTVTFPAIFVPEIGVTIARVGGGLLTDIDLLATMLSLPVESITLIVKVWLPFDRDPASKLQPKTIEPYWL